MGVLAILSIFVRLDCWSKVSMRFGEGFLYDLPRWQDLGADPWGDGAVSIGFVGGPYAFSGLSAAQIGVTRDRFHGLCRTSLPTNSGLQCTLSRVDPRCFRTFETCGWNYTFDRDYHQRSVRLAGLDFLGEISLDAEAHGRLWTSQESPEGFPGVFENFFRVLVAYRLHHMGAVLLHSAAISDGQRAYVFLGRSGAGKSTISRLALDAGWEVLSDDMNALLPGPAGWLVEKLPFAGDLGQTPTRTSAYPVAGLFWLEQGEIHAIRPLGKALTTARSLVCAPVVNEDPFRLERLLENLGHLIDMVGMRTLCFARAPGFLDLLVNDSEVSDGR